MDRLTIRNRDGTVSQPMGLRWADALEKLASYEDTGLTPEEVAELAAAKEAGRLVALPCKAGDIVYDKDAEPYAVFSIQLYSKKVVHLHCISPTTGQKKSFSIGKRSLGRTVFLTREEAEAAAKGEDSMKGGWSDGT